MLRIVLSHNHPENNQMPSLTPKEWRTIADAVFQYNPHLLGYFVNPKTFPKRRKIGRVNDIHDKLIAKRDNLDCFGNR